MNDRAFRLDFFIAIAALLVSAFTAATLLYQTRVIGDQFAATIWPYVSVGTTYDSNGEAIEITNDGLGPAMIRSAQLTVDGNPVRSWNDYVRVLALDPSLRRTFEGSRRAFISSSGRAVLSMSSVGPSTTLRPGESDQLLRISLAQDVPAGAFAKHVVTIELCYCSLNGACWTLHSTPGRMGSDPRAVSGCASASAIESNAFTTAKKAGRAASR